MIIDLDVRLATVSTTVKEAYNSLDQDKDGKVSLSDVKASISAGTTAVTAAVAKTTEEKVGQLKTMQGDLSKKAVAKLEQGLAQVNEHCKACDGGVAITQTYTHQTVFGCFIHVFQFFFF